MPSMLFLVLSLLVLVSFVLQRIYRRTLTKERYHYMRDLTLVGAWMVFSLWTGRGDIRVVAAMALLGAVVGLFQHMLLPQRDSLWLYGLLGILFAFVGPRISFIGLPGGEYLYLSRAGSIGATALWVTVFPLLFHRLDEVPGLAGHLLGVSFSLILLISSVSGQSLGGAFVMSLAGLAFTAVFWSRLGHNYRRLGTSLSAFWGVLVAGTSLVGVSKGVTITTLMVIPLGLYALPLVEVSLNLIAHAVPLGRWGQLSIYHRMMDRGADHPEAVKFVTFLCLSIGALISFLQIGIDETTRPALLAVLVVSISVKVSCLRRSHFRESSSLWGVSVDGISMNYALSKVRAQLLARGASALVVTVNALSLIRARHDEKYRSVADGAWLTLPDGVGLVWGLRFLGMKVNERVAGIDFMQRLCRLAASEGWPIYLLGSRAHVVMQTASVLQDRYPGLIVAGYRDGYFDDDTEVVEDIRRSGARLVFAALGVPKQELWLDSHLDDLPDVVAVGVGGSFDVISGRLKRAPQLWQKVGMEWLYRLIQEPWRLKQDGALVWFIVAVLLEKVGLGRRRKLDDVRHS
ncbi:MAG: glycosyl transferase [Dethiosulfovibrio peptidovorans]|nr:MAG: glycosyl transferase [Dethiosulfovibrio peptidovorans]